MRWRFSKTQEKFFGLSTLLPELATPESPIRKIIAPNLIVPNTVL